MEIERVLPRTTIRRAGAAPFGGNGSGLEAARRLGPTAVIEDLGAAGLRGRGGAGFPTATKWSAVRAGQSEDLPDTVVVNAAEGEPGSYKDRTLLQRNPYAVLEGALIAAFVVGADRVVIGTRRSFTGEIATLERAIAEVRDAGWLNGVGVTSLEVLAGPEEYLVGEETALLEVIDGRPPFPRVAPPYRRGVDDIAAHDVDKIAPPPALVNNVETMAHVAAIMAEGPTWFREYGTDASPGTIVCTVSGPGVRRAAVGEFALGTPLRTIIDELGGGAVDGHEIVAVLPGVANPLLPLSLLDTPASYEAMQAAGSGLGCGAFLVFDDRTDMASLAHVGVSRFLAVESCGQCTPCKQDGIALSEILERIRASEGTPLDMFSIDDRLGTITNSARCFLAEQHQRVIWSVVDEFEPALRVHVEPAAAPPAEPVFIAPIVRIADGVALLDEGLRAKQPDWTFDAVDSGQAPADRG